MKLAILQTKTIHELLNVKASFIGKGGIITEEFKNMKDLSIEERKQKGQELNEVKTQIDFAIEEQMRTIKVFQINENLESENLDTE